MRDKNSLLDEMLQRLIHIEGKLDKLAQADVGHIGPGQFAGHADQLYGYRTYAQHGDDLVLLNIFDAIGISKPSYLDIGAHHPFNISNTALLYERGSRGINVEANPNLIDQFKIHRSEDINLNCGVSDSSGEMIFYMIDKWSGRNSFSKSVAEDFVRTHPSFRISEEIKIDVVTASDIVSKYASGKFPDLLTIDVEGLEERIIKSIDYKKSAPKVICVETCRSDDAEAEVRLLQFFASVDYFPVLKNKGNSFFIKEEYRYAVTGLKTSP